MQHKRTLSEYKDQTGDGNFIYGYDSQPEDDDSPIMIRSGVSVPVWKTPSTLQDQPKRTAAVSDATANGAFSIADTLSDFPIWKNWETVRGHRFGRTRPSFPKTGETLDLETFYGFVSRYAPGFADESAILQFNLYLECSLSACCRYSGRCSGKSGADESAVRL